MINVVNLLKMNIGLGFCFFLNALTPYSMVNEESSIVQNHDLFNQFVKENFQEDKCITKPYQFDKVNKLFNQLFIVYRKDDQMLRKLSDLFINYIKRKKYQLVLFYKK